ncbi:hypothetical protein LguiB_031694 [Lonicera macranthoides]
MIEKGIYPNVVTYSSLIQGFCNVGQLEEATRLLREMLEKKVSPDVYVRTYKTMINGLCQEGLFDEAKELLMRMEECGSIPDDVTYNVIVQGFLTGSQCSEALLLMEKMVGRGFSPNASTISMLAGSGDWQGCSSQRMSVVGMTLKTLRLLKKGEMLLSVHGSPLGLNNKQEDNNINMVDCRERSDQWMNSGILKDMVVSNIGNHKLTVQEAVADRSLWSQSCEGTMPPAQWIMGLNSIFLMALLQIHSILKLLPGCCAR